MSLPITATPQKAFLSPPPGLLQIAKAEVEALLASPLHKPKWTPTVHEVDGRILVADLDFRLLLELAQRLRCARDVAWVAELGSIRDESTLVAKLAAYPWEQVLGAGALVHCKADSTASRIYHEGMMREKLEETLNRKGYQQQKGEAPSPHFAAHEQNEAEEQEQNSESSAEFSAQPQEADAQSVFLKIFKDKAQLEFSVSGRPHYQRGYRAAYAGKAPLPEHLAAALIQTLLQHARKSEHFDEKKPHAWVVPFAGTGTLGFEAVLAEISLPNDSWRALACGNWSITPQTTWNFIHQKLAAQAAQAASGVEIHFIERNEVAAGALTKNIAHFKTACASVTFNATCGDFFHLPLPSAVAGKDLFLPINPPHGERLRSNSQDDTPKLFARVGERVAKLAKAHNGALHVLALCPDEASWLQFGNGTGLPKKAFHTFHVTHGGRDLRCVLASFESESRE